LPLPRHADGVLRRRDLEHGQRVLVLPLAPLGDEEAVPEALADLRESGSIEQDADVVMFIFREEYYHERAEPKQRPDESVEKFDDRNRKWQERGEKIHNVAEVHIAKQRHGPIGNVPLQFEGALTRFGNLERTDYAPGGDA
jgi:replicative DNA helicase